MKLVDLCQQALTAARQTPTESTPWRSALSALKAGAVEQACDLLAGLADQQLHVAVTALEREGIAQGLSGHELVPLGVLLESRLANEGTDWQVFDPSWEQGWTREVASEVPNRIARSYGPDWREARVRLCLVRSLIDEGDSDGALLQAQAIRDWQAKQERGTAYALVGLAMDGPEADRWLLESVEAATAGPQIADGGHESSALAAVVEVMAGGGLSAVHPAVEAAWEEFLELGQTYVSRDTRAYGLHRAILAAARRAEEGDRAWLEKAAALMPCLKTDWLILSSMLALARVQSAIGRPDLEEEVLRRIPDEAWPTEEVRGLYPDHVELLRGHWERDGCPIGLLRTLLPLGLASESLVERAIASADGSSSGSRDLYGPLMLWAPDRAGAQLEQVWEREKKDAYAIAAEVFWENGRASEAAAQVWRAIDMGWRPWELDRWWPLIIAGERSIDDLEACFATEPDASHRIRLLSGVAQRWYALGERSKALRCVERALLAVARDPEPDWTPYYRIGGRAGWEIPRCRWPVAEPLDLPFSEALAIVEEAPEFERHHALFELATRCTAPDELEQVQSRMERAEADHPTLRIAKRVLVMVLRGQVDSALSLAVELRDLPCSRYSGFMAPEVALKIAGWLGARPREITAERVGKWLSIFSRPGEHEVAGWLALGLPALLPALSEEDRRRIEGLVAKQPVSNPGDLGVVLAGLAAGLARAGDLGQAIDWLERGLGRSTEHGSRYARPLVFVAAILAIGDHPRRAAWLEAAMVFAKHEDPVFYLIPLERAARLLWDGGEQSFLPECVRRGAFPSQVNDMLRRTLVVDAPAYAPRPVEAVIDAWSEQPPNVDQAIEQVRCLAEALEREQRVEEAAAVRDFLQ